MNRAFWWSCRRARHKWRVQNMEKEYTFPLRFGHDTRFRMAIAHCSVASWCHKVFCWRFPCFKQLISVSQLFELDPKERIIQFTASFLEHTQVMSRTIFWLLRSNYPMKMPSLMLLIMITTKEVGVNIYFTHMLITSWNLYLTVFAFFRIWRFWISQWQNWNWNQDQSWRWSQSSSLHASKSLRHCY